MGLVLLTVVTLQACSADKTENTDSATQQEKLVNDNEQLELEILGGEYVIPEDSKGKSYLALEVKPKNKSDDKLEYSNSNFNLYDADGNQVKIEFIYDNDDLKAFSYGSISKEKSASGYLFFDVDKEDTYTMEYSTYLKVADNYKQTEPIELTVNPQAFEDKTATVIDLAEEFVNQVFFATDNLPNQTSLSHSGSVLVTLLNNKEEEKTVTTIKHLQAGKQILANLKKNFQ